MAQPESKLSRAIMQMVRERGGWCFKVHGSEYMMNGVPDIIICYKGYFVAFETKTPEGKKPEPIQLYRHKCIRRAEGIVTVPRSVAAARKVLDDIDASIDDENSSQAK